MDSDASPRRTRSSAVLVVAGSTPVGSVMCVDVRPSVLAAAFILATKALTLARVPVGEDRRHVGSRVDQEPFEGLELRERFPGCDRDLGLLRCQPRLIRGERICGDGDGRPVGTGRQAVVRQHHVGRQHLGQTGDRDGLGPSYLADRPHTDDRRRRFSRAGPRVGRGGPGEADGRRPQSGGGQRSDPLCDGPRAERRHDDRNGPSHDTPAPSLRAQPGDDLELLLARRGELPADFGQALLVLPGQRPFPGVRRTFALPAAAAVHDRNAKAA